MLIESRFGPFWLTAYTVQEYVHGTRAQEYFGHYASLNEDWEENLEEIKKLLKVLNQFRIAHNSLHLKNIIFQNGKPILIDLDRTCSYRSLNNFKHFSRDQKDLKMFSANLKAYGGDGANSIFEKVFKVSD